MRIPVVIPAFSEDAAIIVFLDADLSGRIVRFGA
jgi:hypothetical protein